MDEQLVHLSSLIAIDHKALPDEVELCLVDIFEECF
jgi:hypothetical protein